MAIKIIPLSCLGSWGQLHKRQWVMVLLHYKNLCKYQIQLLVGYPNFWLKTSPSKASSLTCSVVFLLFLYGVVNVWLKGSEDLYMNVHRSIIRNSKNVEIIKMPIKQWLGKQIVVYFHNGILFTNRKKWSETWKYDAKWRKPVTKAT